MSTDENTERKVLPCPCCGSEVTCSAGFQNGYGTYYFVKCSCGLSINGQFEADVLQRWNRRESAG